MRAGMTWQWITCDDREALAAEHIYSGHRFSPWSVAAGLSDIDGEYGTPYVLTEWYDPATDLPTLKDERWPKEHHPCRHARWVIDERITP